MWAVGAWGGLPLALPIAQRRHQVAMLHGIYGNQVVLRMLSHCPPAIQKKLKINEPGDQHEQEADRLADQVMRMPDAAISSFATREVVQRRCAKCEEEEKNTVRPKMAQANHAQPGEAPGIVHEVLCSAGQPLTAATRAFFEPRFGVDLGLVRVHADSRAAESARAVGALAYTVGSDIVFGREQRSCSPASDKLLAHELAHVVQQGAVTDPKLRRQVPSVGSCAALAIQSQTLTGCTAATSASQATSLHDDLLACWIPLVTLKLGTETGSMWQDYLDSSKPLPRPSRTFIAGEIVDGFTKHHRSAEVEAEIIREAAGLVSVAGPLPAPGATSSVPVASVMPGLSTRLSDAADPLFLVYDDPVNTIAGNLAGGVSAGGPPGNTAFDPDTRDADGDLELSLDASGSNLTVTPSLTFGVHDTVDFCPGGLGTGLATVFTVPMSVLEATEGLFGPVFAADVPFDVIYPGPGTASITVPLAPPPFPPAPTPAPPSPAPTPGPTTYTVVPGDYLVKIANDLCGDPQKWRDIYDANKAVIGPDPDVIFPGQVLVIPCASPASP